MIVPQYLDGKVGPFNATMLRIIHEQHLRLPDLEAIQDDGVTCVFGRHVGDRSETSRPVCPAGRNANPWGVAFFHIGTISAGVAPGGQESAQANDFKRAQQTFAELIKKDPSATTYAYLAVAESSRETPPKRSRTSNELAN